MEDLNIENKRPQRRRNKSIATMAKYQEFDFKSHPHPLHSPDPLLSITICF